LTNICVKKGQGGGGRGLGRRLWGEGKGGVKKGLGLIPTVEGESRGAFPTQKGNKGKKTSSTNSLVSGKQGVVRRRGRVPFTLNDSPGKPTLPPPLKPPPPLSTTKTHRTELQHEHTFTRVGLYANEDPGGEQGSLISNTE